MFYGIYWKKMVKKQSLSPVCHVACFVKTPHEISLPLSRTGQIHLLKKSQGGGGGRRLKKLQRPSHDCVDRLYIAVSSPDAELLSIILKGIQHRNLLIKKPSCLDS